MTEHWSGCAQNLKDKIHSHYRVRLILDNLPVTTNDLEDKDAPELMRPGFDVGSEEGGNFYVNNHIMFKILVHKTNGQYTRAQSQMNFAEIEAAAEAEVVISTQPRHGKTHLVSLHPCHVMMLPG